MTITPVQGLRSPFVMGEDLEEEQEHVQDVQEDRRGKERGGGDVRIGPRPLEVEESEPGEDRQAEYRVDHVGARPGCRRTASGTRAGAGLPRRRRGR